MLRNASRFSIFLFVLLVVTLAQQSVSSSATLFSEDFSDNLAGWTFVGWPEGNEWQIGSATASSGQFVDFFPDPEFDHTPTGDNGVAGIVIGGNASITPHEFEYLVSPVIDLGTTTGTTMLEYYRWLNTDFTPFMNATVDVFNGTDWINLVPAPNGLDGIIADSSWTVQAFDISSYVSSLFQLRYGLSVEIIPEQPQTLPLVGGSWNIDDIRIDGEFAVPVPLPAALPLFAASLGIVGFFGWRRKRAIIAA